jgi:hypothetical protein
MHHAARLYGDVITEIQNWVPSQDYDHESKFQNELKDVLDERLNDAGADSLERNREIPAYRERGRLMADLAVDDLVGVEMKRELTNSQAKKLRGQVEAYLDNYNYVILVACGIQDTSNWREMKNRYQDKELAGGGKVKFIWKKKENYKADTDRGQQQEQKSPDDGGSSSSVIPENPILGIEEDLPNPDDYNPFL